MPRVRACDGLPSASVVLLLAGCGGAGSDLAKVQMLALSVDESI